MKRYFGFLLFAELVVVASAPLIFMTIPDRLLAGMVAGTVFVLLGFFIVRSGWKDRTKRAASFWMGCVHLFLGSLPLMITRLMNQAGGFEQVDVLGLPGPVFHRVSTGIFAALIAATVWDFMKAGKAQALKDATWPRDVG